MAYEIKITGYNNPIIVEDDQGMKILSIYENPAIGNDHKVWIGANLFTSKGKIRGIQKVANRTSSQNDSVSDTNKQDDEIYKSWVTKPANLRAHRDELFKQVYKIVNGDFPTQEVLNALAGELETFFIENPKRTYGDARIYLKYLGEDAKKKNISRVQMVMFNMLENVIVNDIRKAKIL